ncbi:pyruvate carboxylase, partial [Microvirga sp. 3-52]|nr:pyruvate carboxylase [Microvirga sp. 3-52]
GQPHGGFPKELQKIILKDREAITVRPGELLKDADFEQMRDELNKKLNRLVTSHEVLSYALYPKVFEEYSAIYKEFGDVSVIATPEFLYGLRLGEEVEIEIEKGKTLIVKLVSISEPQSDATRVIYFEINGQPREIIIEDANLESNVVRKTKADPAN